MTDNILSVLSRLSIKSKEESIQSDYFSVCVLAYFISIVFLVQPFFSNYVISTYINIYFELNFLLIICSFEVIIHNLIVYTINLHYFLDIGLKIDQF